MQAGIHPIIWDYCYSAGCDRVHQSTAWRNFLPPAPYLMNRSCAWYETPGLSNYADSFRYAVVFVPQLSLLLVA